VYVIDASVFIKWVVAEDDSDKALMVWQQARADRTSMAAPDLLLYETGNILVRKKGFEVQDVKRTIRLLIESDIDIRPLNTALILQAVEMADATGCSVYDGTYLALTRELNGTLVTADRRLAELGSSVADVRLLAAF